MFSNIVTTVLEISLGTSIVIFVLILLSSVLNKKYDVKWKYCIWLILAIRLILPINITFLQTSISFSIPDVNINHDIPNVNSSHVENIQGQREPIIKNIDGSTQYSILDIKDKPPLTTYEKGMTFSDIIVMVWIMGAVLFMMYQLGSYYSFRKQVLRWGRSIKNIRIIEQFEEVLQQIKIKKSINIFISEKVSSPMMIGFLKPILLFPCEDYTDTDLHYIIKHELVHFKRYDIWYKLLLLIANAVHWFNPLVYLMVKEANKDIELYCDEEVVRGASFDYRKQYSNTILNSISYGHKRQTALSTYFYQYSKIIKKRLEGILDMRIKKSGIIVFSIVLVCTFLAGGMMVCSIQKQDVDRIMLEHPKPSDDDIMYLSEVWAESLKSRNGKPRFETMSEKLKEQFIEEQKKRKGSNDWNYNIGSSSPWVVDYEITIDGNIARIIYFLEDSTPQYYNHIETLTLGKENGKLVVIDVDKSLNEWERYYYFAPTAEGAMEIYKQALLESDYMKLLALTHQEKFHIDGQKIWDTVKIREVKVKKIDVRENKACYKFELNIEDGGASVFETGILPRWLFLVKGEHGWYVEGLMTGGEPNKKWWTN